MKNPLINSTVQKINDQAIDHMGRLNGDMAYDFIQEAFTEILKTQESIRTDEAEEASMQNALQEEKRGRGRPPKSV